jgi:CheY-like chemotaxis protein
MGREKKREFYENGVLDGVLDGAETEATPAQLLRLAIQRVYSQLSVNAGKPGASYQRAATGANMKQAPLKVMIVDDALIVRERFSQILNENHAVEIVGQAADAKQAMRILPTAQPDVMLLDLRLPDGSGLCVLRQLREAGSTCQVMMLTSDPYPHCRERCLAAGADYFFDKTEEFEQVIAELTRLSVNR